MKRVEAYARVIALLWAVVWSCVFLYQALEWRTVIPASAAWTVLGALFLLLAFLPWRWELSGGLLLIICGAGLAIAYAVWPVSAWKPWHNVLIHASLSGPPTLAGFLFIIHGLSADRRKRTATVGLP